MTLFRMLTCAALLLLPGWLLAHGDEDHGTASAAVASPLGQLPRVEAASELFELVGVLQGDTLLMHIDRFASNEPVAGAKVSVEGGPLKATAAVERDGTYAVSAVALRAAGTHPLVFTVQTGESSDLLTGDLVVSPSAAASAQSASAAARWGSTPVLAAAAVVLALLAGGLAWHLRRLRRRRRTARAGALS